MFGTHTHSLDLDGLHAENNGDNDDGDVVDDDDYNDYNDDVLL